MGDEMSDPIRALTMARPYVDLQVEHMRRCERLAAGSQYHAAYMHGLQESEDVLRAVDEAIATAPAAVVFDDNPDGPPVAVVVPEDKR